MKYRYDQGNGTRGGCSDDNRRASRTDPAAAARADRQPVQPVAGRRRARPGSARPEIRQDRPGAGTQHVRLPHDRQRNRRDLWHQGIRAGPQRAPVRHAGHRRAVVLGRIRAPQGRIVNAGPSKTAAAVLERMRRNPEVAFYPVSQRDEKDARRLVSLGLAICSGSKESEWFGLPHPLYSLTEAGRALRGTISSLEKGGEMITITHTHEGGTLIEGSTKGDGVYEVLKGLGTSWRYFPSLRQIGLGQSRDKAAQTWKINAAAEALRAAGHEVTVEVDNGITRTFAEAEAGRYDRADDRAERSAHRSETATANGERMWSETSQVYEALNGQPILVGHHSERRHRNLLDKTHAKEGRAVDEIKRGRHWASRAAAAERYRATRENVPATLRRIEKLEAEERGVKRGLDGRLDWDADGKLRMVKPEGA